MILGIDVSTTCTGYCVTDNAGKVIFLSSLKTPAKYDKSNFNQLYLLAEDVAKQINENLFNESIDILKEEIEIIIEAPLGGSQNARTVNMLLTYNAILSSLLVILSGRMVKHITRSAALKLSVPGLYQPRKKGSKASLLGHLPKDLSSTAKKQYIARFILDKNEIEYETTKQGNLKSIYIDMADAIIIAQGYHNLIYK